MMIVQAEHEFSRAVAGSRLGAWRRWPAPWPRRASLARGRARGRWSRPPGGVSGADVAVVRVCAQGRELEAVAVAGPAGLAAELEGTFVPPTRCPASVDLLGERPAQRARGSRPARRPCCSFRSRRRGLCDARAPSRRRAVHTGRSASAPSSPAAWPRSSCVPSRRGADRCRALARPALELAGEALAAALDESRAGGRDRPRRRRASSVRPSRCSGTGEGDALELAASHGLERR